MNHLQNQKHQERSGRLRHGLSIIEVLTSIVVAMIGVFGIMVLIPFAVKQTQSGLDRDASTALARNAMATLEIRGYRNPDNWSANLAGASVDPAAPQPILLDPLFVAESAFATFPYAGIGAALPAPLQINNASLFSPIGSTTAMSVADARRMFVGENELVFEKPADELAGPVQVQNASSAGIGPVGRQSRGSLSWTVLMVPYRSTEPLIATSTVGRAWSYRAYVIVYKNRYFADLTDDEAQMYVAQVAAPTTAVTPPQPVGAVYLDTTPSMPDHYSIGRDDWVMVVNDRDTTAANVEAGFESQIGFFRVTNYDIDETPGARKLNSVSLDGPDFDFTAADANGTYLIHLKDVVAVYERSILEESFSNWN